MDELDRFCQPEPGLPGTPSGLRREADQRRPDHLALRAQHVAHQLADKGIVGRKLLLQQAMQP